MKYIVYANDKFDTIRTYTLGIPPTKLNYGLDFMYNKIDVFIPWNQVLRIEVHHE